MGNISASVQKIVSVVENSTKSACRFSQATDQNMNIMLDLTDTNCPDLIFRNIARQKAECNMGSIAESLAEASMAMSKEQTLGLPAGINADSTVMERTAKIKQYLEQECGSEQAIRQNLNLALRGKNVTCKQLQAVNDSDQTSQCIINAAVKQISKDDITGSSKQKADLLGPLASAITSLFTGPLLILGGIILAIGLLLIIFRLFRGVATKADAAGTASELPSETVAVKGLVERVAQAAESGKGLLESVKSVVTAPGGIQKPVAPPRPGLPPLSKKRKI